MSPVTVLDGLFGQRNPSDDGSCFVASACAATLGSGEREQFVVVRPCHIYLRTESCSPPGVIGSWKSAAAALGSASAAALVEVAHPSRV